MSQGHTEQTCRRIGWTLREAEALVKKVEHFTAATAEIRQQDSKGLEWEQLGQPVMSSTAQDLLQCCSPGDASAEDLPVLLEGLLGSMEVVSSYFHALTMVVESIELQSQVCAFSEHVICCRTGDYLAGTAC